MNEHIISILRPPYRLVKKICKPIFKIIYHGDKYECNICHSNLKLMKDGGINDVFFEQHRVIGGGARKHVTCPVCNSGDRERFVYYYLKHNTDLFKDSCSAVLHFAPEPHIEQEIRNNPSCKYITGDIVPGRADYVVDITNIQFSENMFDYVICNHVIEHIIDEEKAINELKRVLKPDGTIILSTPISISDEKTYENPNIISPEDRLKYFGQEDHVRLYGLDVKERWSKYGLIIDEYNSEDITDKNIVDKYGFIVGDRIFICKKAESF